MTRASTWTNPDGLVVGFGRNFAERQDAGVQKDAGSVKTAKVQIDLVNSTFGSTGAKITIPAGSKVMRVWAKATVAHAGGTSMTFGDAADPDGWIVAADWANPAANVQIPVKGVYAEADFATTPAVTDTEVSPKIYASDTDLYFTKVGTYTAGEADVYVDYV